MELCVELDSEWSVTRAVDCPCGRLVVTHVS